jgi:hypothetical protein
MPFSPSFWRNAKIVFLMLLGMSLIYLSIFIYFNVITIPYLNPLVITAANTLSPLTPLFNPILFYFNLTNWFHPPCVTYRKTLKRKQYLLGVFCQLMASLAMAFSVSLKLSWVMENIYGLRDGEGMCVGPCWKLWAELGLLGAVVVVKVVGLELDGGMYGRYLDMQLVKLKEKDAEKAAKKMVGDGDIKEVNDIEKARI